MPRAEHSRPTSGDPVFVCERHTDRVHRFTAMSKKRVQSRHGHRPLPEVEAFIRLIDSNLSTLQGSPQGGLWFSRAGEGSLFLDPEETRSYRALVALLIEKFVKGEDLSQRSVESYLQEALFSSSTSEARLRSRSTTASSQPEPDSSSFSEHPRKNGGVGSRSKDLDSTRRGPNSPASGLSGSVPHSFSRSPCGVRERRRPVGSRGGKYLRSSVEYLWNGVCAVVVGEARDCCRRRRAGPPKSPPHHRRGNLFTDLVPYNHGWVYFPGDTAKSRMVVAIQNENGDFSRASQIVIHSMMSRGKACGPRPILQRRFAVLAGSRGPIRQTASVEHSY